MTQIECVDPDWLPFHPNPVKPNFKLPAGAVDSHCHVFGPAAEFPFAPERKYTPCDASKHELFRLRDHLGFTRNVVVQATCHGKDNRALVDTLMNSNGLARGVASVSVDIADEELTALHQAGVRGVRFNFVKRLVNKLPHADMQSIAERIASLGWHIVIYFEAEDIDDIWDLITHLPTIVVVDHMGRPDLTKPVDGGEFQRFVALLQEHPNFWCKVTCPERLSLSGPPGYDDFIPFAKHIVETFPDRVLWGTDWPHPNMKSHMPDDGHLVDIVPRIAVTKPLQQSLLIDNPMRLYWPDS